MTYILKLYKPELNRLLLGIISICNELTLWTMGPSLTNFFCQYIKGSIAVVKAVSDRR